MIKFFRKIRHKLIAEGKTANYFKYAIGEILLVVIGILIALQINNWNSDRIEAFKYKKQLLKVVENIKSDSIQIEQLKNNRIEMVKQTSQMKQELQNRNIKKPDEFLNLFMKMTGETKFVSNMDIELGSQFENYQNVNIHELLDDYQKLVEKVKFREYRHNEFSENLELVLWNNGFFRTIDPKIIKDEGNGSHHISFKNIDMNTIGIYDNEALYALCLRSNNGFTLLISEYDELSAKGQELNKAIKNFLKKQ